MLNVVAFGSIKCNVTVFIVQVSAVWSIALTAQDVFCLKTKEAANVQLDIMLTSVTKVGTVSVLTIYST